MREVLRRLTAPNAVDALLRFPVAALAASMIAGRELVRNDFSILGPSSAGAAWTFGWAVALLASVALSLFGEAVGAKWRLALQPVALLLGGLAWLGHGQPFLSPFWTIVALLTSIFLAPAPGRDEQQLWTFNARLAAHFLFAFVVVSIIVLGTIGIKISAEYLFELKFDRRWTGSIVTIGYWFALPLYWCVLVPRDAASRGASNDLLFRAGVVLGAVLAVVVAILAGLLHVYAGKIAFDGVMPQNQVGRIASAALLAGIAGWVFSAWEGGPLAGFRRSFRRFWFPFTAIPAVLLVVAAVQRIEAYGVTPDRYTLMVVAAGSFAFLLLCAARLRAPSIRSVLVASTVVATVAAVGPVSQSALVAESQMTRLKDLLARQGMMADGRLAPPAKFETLNPQQRREIQSVLLAIDRAGAIGRLSELAHGEKLASIDDALRRIGVRDRPFRITSFAGQRTSVEVDGGRLVGPFTVYCGSDRSSVPPSVTFGDATIELREGKLSFRWPSGETAFDLATLAGFATERQSLGPSSVRSIDGQSVLAIQYIQFQKGGDVVTPCAVAGVAVVRPR